MVKFGVESCDLSLKNANTLYLECQNAFDDTKLEIEQNKDIVEFLKYLQQLHKVIKNTLDTLNIKLIKI